MKFLDIDIFATSLALPFGVPSSEFFGGFLMKLQNSDIRAWVAVLILTLALVILRYHQKPNAIWIVTGLLLGSILSILVSLKVSEGWDELFLNLKHSAVWMETGRFSYNTHEMVEGTVDFLPFLAAGLLGRIFLPLVDSIIALTLLGNVLVIVVSWLIARRLTSDPLMALVMAVGIGLQPSLCFVGGTGFTATIFTGWILLSIYLLFFSEPRYEIAGLVVLSLLTLIRTEGIAFAGLVWGYLYACRPIFARYRPAEAMEPFSASLRRAVVAGLILGLPFVISCIVRKAVFGYALPNPIPFKYAEGNSDYLVAGIAQLQRAIHLQGLDWIFILGAGPLAYVLKRKLLPGSMAAVLGLMGAFCLLYYTGGGDWFPEVWGRYLMPLSVIGTLLIWVGWRVFAGSLTDNRALILLLSVLMPVAVANHLSLSSGTAYAALKNTALDDAALSHISSGAARWRRIDALGYTGRYFEKTTPRQAVICSSEVGTIMYFARRDLLDLLGTANPEIAHAPLTPLTSANLIHRRRNPATIARHRPSIICYDGSTVFNLPKSGQEHFDEKAIRAALQTFNQIYSATVPLSQSTSYTRRDIAQYRAGSLEHLKALGYRYVMVMTPDVNITYLIQNDFWAEHLRYFQALGIKKVSHARLPYTIHPEIEKQFP
jgi:hypothetical protein